MPIPRRYTTDAIVLSRFDLGEADRVLTLITPTGGKLKAIAKGVRRPTSRLGGSLEPFAELNRRPGPGPDVRRRDRGPGRARLAPPARFARIRRPPPGTSPSSPTARSRSATPPSRCTRCSAGPTSCSTPRWRPGGSRAGTRCTSSTSSASGPRWTAASNATGSSRRTSDSAGCRRSAGSCASGVPVRRTIGRASASRRSSCSRPTSGSISRRSRPSAWRPTSNARPRPPCATSSAARSSATRARWRSSTRSGHPQPVRPVPS